MEVALEDKSMATQIRKTKSVLESAPLPETYRELVDELMPTLIETDSEHKKALAMVRRLMATDKQLNKEQGKYLRLVAHLVQDYERTKHLPAKVSGIDMLQVMMEEHGLTAADVARLLGLTRSMATRILKNQRTLTWGHAQILSERFGVKPEFFMEK